MRGQSRLMRRGSRYYFRARVPVDLLDHYAPRKEITFSLKTSDRKVAVERVHVESLKLDQEFEALRLRCAAEQVAELSDDLIKQLSTAYLSKMLTADEDIRRRRFEFPNGSKERTHAYYSKLLDGLPQFKKRLAMGDTAYVEIGMSHFLEGFGINLAKDSGSYRKLAYELMKAHVKSYELASLRHQGEVIDTPPAPPIAAAKANPNDGMKLSRVFEAWAAERKPPAKTLAEWNLVKARFIKIHGDLAATSVVKRHVVEFKDKLLEMKLAEGTIVKQLGALHTVFEWAVNNDHCQANPARGVTVAAPKTEKESRLPYGLEELNLLFRSPVFSERKRPRGGAGEAAFWLPLLALFTGARREELAQLLVSDVREQDGAAYLDISDREGGKSVKNETSRRRVPLHPELIRCGFLRYVDEQRSRKSERLFPRLLPDHFGDYGGNWGKWYSRYARSIGITDRRKTFHSFRHAFKYACRESHIPEDIHDALTGHSNGTVGRSYGGPQYPLAPLAEAIERLRYPGLDLSHLQKR